MKTKNASSFFKIPSLLMVLSLFALIFINACKKDDTDDNTDNTPQTISDTDFYKRVASSIIACVVDIYNQNIAGTPGGGKDLVVNGPLEGTCHITGSCSQDTQNDITTTDLNFDMDSITYQQTVLTWNTQLKLHGSISFDGSFSDTYTSVTHDSQYLYIDGKVTYGTVSRIIRMTGIVSINRSSSVTAVIFGHTVSW